MNTTSNSLWVGYALLSAVFARADLHSGKAWHQRHRFQSCHRDSDGGGAGDGMGNRFYDRSQQAAAEYRRALLDFLILSGIATGLSWLFYYRALQLGDASKVVD